MDNPPLRFGIAPPNWGVFRNPHHAAELAWVAERAGWHGYFTWDGLPVKDNPPPIYDPLGNPGFGSGGDRADSDRNPRRRRAALEAGFAGYAGAPAAPGWGRLPVRCLRCG